MKRRLLLVFVFGALLASGLARADEGGLPFWLSGQFASFAAVPEAPGFYLPVMGYYFQGVIDLSKTLKRGEIVAAGLRSKAPSVFITPTFVPDAKFLYGRPSFSMSWGGGYNWASAQITGPMGNPISVSDSLWGITDLYPLVSLAWGGDLNNAMIYGTGDIPVGSYDSKRLANLGIGHGAADAGGGYTLLSKKIGTQVSAVVGFTFNLTNPSTNYQNGVDFHLDWAVSQFLSKSFHLGAVGYFYDQVTGDSGSGDKIGAFESKVASVGGEAGYFFSVAGNQWYANLRGYWEFWSKNRLPGFSIFATLNIPITEFGKK
jgi:hypothetical protein